MAGEDRQLAIARIYAQAIFSLAEARGAAEQILAELEEVDRFLAGSPRVAAGLLSPLVDAPKRRQALERIFRERASDLFVDTLQVLNARGRLSLLGAVATAYREVYQRARRVLDVEVTSAIALSDAQRDGLRQMTQRLTGEAARLVERIDPQLLGGLVVRMRDQKYDSSVATQLARLRSQFRQRASREIIAARALAS